MKKFNLIVPIAGLGSRFTKEGFHLPKPLILIDDRSIIEWTMSCIDYSECNVIFIVRKEHILNFNLDGYLRDRFGKDITIVPVEENTQGSVCSCLLAKEYIDNEMPLIIHCSDIYCEPKFIPQNANFVLDAERDGLILTFKSNSNNYSYIDIDDNGLVKRTAEKEVISPNAAVGIYCFKHGSDFVKFATKMIIKKLTTRNEYFISPLYNLFIEDGLNISTQSVDKMHIFGTPEELKFFKENSLKTWSSKKKTIALCSDHSGFDTKEVLKYIIRQKELNYIDFGVFDKSQDRDYAEYVKSAAEAVLNGSCELAIGSCRSGNGINICANKIKGIRSALIFDEYLAEYAVRHNCCNFFSLSEKYVSISDINKILDSILFNSFDGGRHQIRITKIE